MNELKIVNEPFFGDIKQLINEARQRVALSVNAELTLLYWQVGKRIKQEIITNSRADYGKQVIANLSLVLSDEYGSGWSRSQLHHCLHTAEVYPDIAIVHTLRTQLSWFQIKLHIAKVNELKKINTLKC